MIDSDHELSAGPRLARVAGRFLFGKDAAGYHAARLDYPNELFQRIFDLTGRAGIAMLEIGAGTGLATAALLDARPSRLVVVEPDPALAAFLRGRFAGDGVDIVEVGIEDIEVDERFDLVAAATSFHWLDPKAALERARALLRPGGHIAIWWNVYRQPGIGDPFADRIVPLLKGMDLPMSETATGHYSLDTALHRAQFAEAGFEMAAEHVFRRERSLSASEARALYSSHSWVRALAPDRREALLAALERIVEEDFGGSAPNIVLTPLYVARAPS